MHNQPEGTTATHVRSPSRAASGPPLPVNSCCFEILSDTASFSCSPLARGASHAAHMQDSGSVTARAGILGQTERFEEALTHYNLAVDLQPKGKGALYNRGNILMGLDRFGEAGVKKFS